MSGLLGSIGVANQAYLRGYSDDIRKPLDQWRDYRPNNGTLEPWRTAVLWPNSAYGFLDGMFDEMTMPEYWEAPILDNGGSSFQKIIGTTRDSVGTALGSCVVQGFITSTDAFVSEMVSDAGGYFEFCTPFPSTQHYLVAYKAGSPDVAGTTVNTLVPV